MNLDEALSGVLQREGGFVNHPDDRGGPTNRGITQATLAQWRGHAVTIEDVQALTEDEARAIYRRRYLEDPGFLALPGDELKSIMLDAAVHHGVTGAIKMLQRALGTKPDGILGPATLTAAQSWDTRKLAVRMLAQRARLFGMIIQFDRSQSVFAGGWLNRLAEQMEALA